MTMACFVMSVALLLVGLPAAPAEIHDAVKAGNTAAVSALLEKTPALVNARDETGRTPLHWAARGTSAAMLTLLVERGADVNAVDSSGAAPLHVLAGRGDLAGIGLLLGRGADINIRAGDGATPLHAAAMGRQVAALRLLAGRKADLESGDLRGRTPLIVAAREMRGPAVIGALLDLGANVDAGDKYGDTALTLAAWRGSGDVVALLLSREASIPVNTPIGRQLLESAVSTGLADLFRRILDKGADLDIRLGQGRTLLHSAAEGGSVPIIGALVERRFAVNQFDAYGWAPLHFAADMGRSEAVAFLLSKGADLNARTVMGQSAFNIADENGDTAMTALLAGKGAERTPPRFPDLRGPYMGQKPPGQAPEIFAPGIVSARYGMHSTIVFSPDGTEAFWSVMIPPRGAAYGTGRTLVSRRVEGRWTYPRPAIFDGTPLDDVPFFHPKGHRLYDMSDRPLPGGRAAGKENVWVWDKGAKDWTNPRPVDASVNRLPHHWQFSVDRADTLYFTSTWGGARGIFSARLVDGQYAEPEPLGSTVGPDAEFPFIAPDGSYLLFARRMVIHICFRDREGRWGEPVSLGPEYTGMLPIVSPDGKYLFFSRDQRAHWVDAGVIERLRPKQP